MSNQPANLPTSVALRIIETTPAVVKFNYEEMEANLDAVLGKYQGLTFTDSDAAECKKTIAELRKGQKALSEFRIKTKKELTESVTAFEKQCKKLHDKFETVINPLTTQNDQFELDRREKKRVEIQSIIDSLIIDHGLWETYAFKLTILEEYFNKGKSIKAIKTELSTLATSLKVQQDKKEQDEDLIKTKVELANAQHQLIENAMSPEQYLRLLTYNKSIAEIELLINSDAQQIVDREKKAAEARAAKAADIPKVARTISSPCPAQMPSAGNPVPTEGPVEGEATTIIYRITGTDEQLTALEGYLDANDLTWIDVPDEDNSEDDDDDDDDDFMN